MISDSEQLNRIQGIIIRSVAGVSLIPYICSFIFFFGSNKKFDINTIINCQLCLSNLIYTSSYLLPKFKEGTIGCKIQVMLNSFSELTNISVAIAIVLLARLNFVSSVDFEKKQKKYFVLSIVICWIIPIIIAIITIFYGKSVDYSEFCWYQAQAMIFVYFFIRGFYFMSYYVCAVKLWDRFAIYSKTLTNKNLFLNYMSKFTRYSWGVTLMFCVYFLYSLSDTLSFFEHPVIWLWFSSSILDIISHPVFLVIFIFDKNNWEEFKKIITCSQDPPHSARYEMNSDENNSIDILSESND